MLKSTKPTFDFQNQLLESMALKSFAGENAHEQPREKSARKFIIGIDEAGRGPLAGDVFACAVWIDDKKFPYSIADMINDSKKISEAKREDIFDMLMPESGKSLQFGIGRVNAQIIDKINILQATFLAMRNAYLELSNKLSINNADAFVMIDGNAVPEFFKTDASGFADKSVHAVVKGDALSMSIAAASIIAKVARDRYIRDVAKKFPLYGFEKHKGYGTAAHIKAIKKFGPCAEHRKSFLKSILK